MKLLIVIVLFPHLLFSYSHNCAPCSCTRKIDGDALITAVCDGQNLEQIPKSVDKKIEVLHFKGNSMRELIANDLMDYPSLQELSLNYNQITSVSGTSFNGLCNLTKLNLNNNKIAKLPASIFYSTLKLTYLWLNNNNISEFSPGLFSNMLLLKEIHLQDNQINHVPVNTFINVPELSTVDLSKNHLQFLHESILNSLPNIQYFILHDNPWNCNEDFCKFREKALEEQLLPNIPRCSALQENYSWTEISNNSLQLSIDKIVVQEGDTAVFSCEYFNCKAANLSLERVPDELLAAGPTKLQFRLEHVNKGHEGPYRCLVKGCSTCGPQEIYLNVSEKEDTAVTTINPCNSTTNPEESAEWSWPSFGLGALSGALPMICLTLACCIPCCNCCCSCSCNPLSKIIIQICKWLIKRHKQKEKENNRKSKEENYNNNNPLMPKNLQQ